MSEAVARTAVVDRAVVRDLQWRLLRSGEAPDSFPDDPVGTFSVAAFDHEDDVIGAATFIPESTPAVDLPDQWRLRGMATAAEAQGRGVGARVLAAGFVEVAARGGRSVWCNARSSALGFYLGQGFTTVGEEFVVAELGLPHYVAARMLPSGLIADRPSTAPA